MVDIDQIRRQSFDSLYNSATVEVAKKLKENFASIAPIVGGNIAVPTDEEYIGMAQQLIREREMTIRMSDGSRREVSLEEIKKKLPDDMREGFGASIESAVPHTDHMHFISGAIGDGVAKQTSGFGFIRNAIVGFFKWVMSGFEGGFAGIKENIARVTAENIRESVGDELTALRARNPNITMLSDDVINTISGSAYRQALEKGGLTPPPPEEGGPQPHVGEVTPDVLANVQTHEIKPEMQSAIREGMRNTVRNAVAGEILDDTAEGMNKWESKWYTLFIPTPGWVRAGTAEAIGKATFGLVGGNAVVEQEDINRASELVADKMTELVTDPNFRHNGMRVNELSPEEFSELARAQARETLNEHKGEIGGLARHIDKISDGVYNNLMGIDPETGIQNPAKASYAQLPLGLNTPSAAVLAQAQGAVDPNARPTGMAEADPADTNRVAHTGQTGNRGAEQPSVG